MRVRLLLAGVAVVAAAGARTAYMDSNTVPPSSAGETLVACAPSSDALTGTASTLSGTASTLTPTASTLTLGC